MSKLQNIFLIGLLFALSEFGRSSGIENVIIRAARPYEKTNSAIQASGDKVTHQFKHVGALWAHVPLAALSQVRTATGVVWMGKDIVVHSSPRRSVLESPLLDAGSPLELQASSMQPLSGADVYTSCCTEAAALNCGPTYPFRSFGLVV